MADHDKTEIFTGGKPSSTQPPNSDDAMTRIPTKADAKAGHLTIIDGHGKGASLPVYSGQNDISRSESARVQLNFGDMTVSRDPPVLLECEPAKASFVLRDNGHPNPVTINGTRLQGAKAIVDGDRITIGKTTLRFTAL